MAANTPSSLKWLIGKQIRLNGQIQRKRELLEQARILVTHHRTDIKRLEHDLAAIETAMGLHEIRIHPSDLAPVRPHYTHRVLRHGEMTRIILRTLAHSPEKTSSTSEILQAVLAALPRPLVDDQLRTLRGRLRVRLSIMAIEGRIVQLPNARTCEPRVWRLPTRAVDPP